MKAFECKMCGECCYGSGGIKVSDIEIGRISEFLNICPEDFRSKYCELRNRELMLVSGNDGYCIFYDLSDKCLIHKVKPAVCNNWPFNKANTTDEYTWRMVKEACPGINPDTAFEEFIKKDNR